MLLDTHLLPVGINSSRRLESATSWNYEYFRYECFVKPLLFSPKKLKPITFYTGTKHWPWCTSIYSVQNVTTRVLKFPQKINSLAIDHVVTLAAADGRTDGRARGWWRAAKSSCGVMWSALAAVQPAALLIVRDIGVLATGRLRDWSQLGKVNNALHCWSCRFAPIVGYHCCQR